MALFHRIFPGGTVATFFEAPGGGHPLDIDAPRNAPAKFPVDYLDQVFYHSSFDLMALSHGPTVVSINHAGIAAAGVPPNASIAFGWASASADHLLLKHNLGYPPIALAVYDDVAVLPTTPVQVQSDGGARYATVTVDNTDVRLHEFGSSGVSNLAAVSRSYTVMVFREPDLPSGNVLLDFDPGTGVVTMGRNRFISLRRYLQVVPGGSPFGIPLGPTIDLNNGAPRFARPSGTVFDPVPAMRLGLQRYPGWPTVYGATMAYGGSFVGPSRILVQAP